MRVDLVASGKDHLTNTLLALDALLTEMSRDDDDDNVNIDAVEAAIRRSSSLRLEPVLAWSSLSPVEYAHLVSTLLIGEAPRLDRVETYVAEHLRRLPTTTLREVAREWPRNADGTPYHMWVDSESSAIRFPRISTLVRRSDSPPLLDAIATTTTNKH